MKDKLTRNLSLKIIAILSALALWMISVDINDPVQKKTFSNIPVQLVNTASITGQGKTYKVQNNTDTVRITIYAHQTTLNQIEEDDFLVQADLTQIREDNTVPLELTVDRYVEKNLESVELERKTLSLSIENLLRKQLSIDVVQNGKPESGYVTGKITTDTNTMRVSGPQSVIDRIEQAVVEISLDGVEADINMQTPIRLLDKSGTEISGADIKKSVENVKVMVPILSTKMVPVHYTSMGEPAAGYVATGNLTASVEEVLLAGRESVLAQIESIEVPETILNLENQTSDVTALVDLKQYIPGDVILGDKSFDGVAEVTAEIAQIRRKSLIYDAAIVQLNNVPAGYMVEALPNQNLRVDLLGLQDKLDAVDLGVLTPHADVGQFLGPNYNADTTQMQIPVRYLLPAEVAQNGETKVNVQVIRLAQIDE